MYTLPPKARFSSSVGNGLFNSASLDLPFAKTKSLVDATTGANLVDFTRASSGTYVDSEGVIRTATTNLLLRSEEFDDASWSKVRCSITQNSIESPVGTATADSMVATDTDPFISQVVTGASGTYTLSVYLRAKPGNSSNEVRLRIRDTVSGIQSSSIFTITTSWNRYQFTATTPGTPDLVRIDAPDNAIIGDTVYIWGAQLEQSTTVGEYIPTTSTINSAPRFDHDPTTGESLGLLVEEQRTNSITNNMMVGAVAGTPGTNPTGWVYATAQSNGLTISIAGTGVENGINYIDYRFNGTTVASPNSCAIGIVSASAATAQTWTASTYWKLAAGSTTGIVNWQLGLIEGTAGGGFVAGAFYSQTAPTSAALITQRPAATRTLSGGGTVGIVTFPINVPVTGNTAIDFTLRIGLPQLEQGAFATSVIPTTGATATRAADVASISGSNFSSWYRQDEGTVFAEGSALTTTARWGAFNSTASFSECINFGSVTGGQAELTVRTPTTTTAVSIIAGSALTAGAVVRDAFRYAVNDFAVTRNGVTPSTSTSGNLPNARNTFYIGVSANTFTYHNGHMRRLTYWPARLPNETLQNITQ
jgi:hypothetical protein